MKQPPTQQTNSIEETYNYSMEIAMVSRCKK